MLRRHLQRIVVGVADRLQDIGDCSPPVEPYRYFLVTQVFTAEAEYICTQLLGIDLRAVKYLEAQGCDRRTGDKLSAADRERIQACLDEYPRFVVTKATDAVLGHVVGTGQKIQ
jgi:hypothetical protein